MMLNKEKNFIYFKLFGFMKLVFTFAGWLKVVSIRLKAPLWVKFAHVLVEIALAWKFSATNSTRNSSLISVTLPSWCSVVHFSLMWIHVGGLSETHLAELAFVPPVWRHVCVGFLWSSRMVSLVVGVQLINRIVVTLADLTDDVAAHLKQN